MLVGGHCAALFHPALLKRPKLLSSRGTVAHRGHAGIAYSISSDQNYFLLRSHVSYVLPFTKAVRVLTFACYSGDHLSTVIDKVPPGWLADIKTWGCTECCRTEAWCYCLAIVVDKHSNCGWFQFTFVSVREINSAVSCLVLCMRKRNHKDCLGASIY